MFLAARSVSHEIETNPTMAKALAVVNAILFCKKLGFNNVIFEGDAMQASCQDYCYKLKGHLLVVTDTLSNVFNSNYVVWRMPNLCML